LLEIYYVSSIRKVRKPSNCSSRRFADHAKTATFQRLRAQSAALLTDSIGTIQLITSPGILGFLLITIDLNRVAHLSEYDRRSQISVDYDRYRATELENHLIKTDRNLKMRFG
jgi:hypothetical protein